MIELSTAEVENVAEQKGVMSELKELHKYLPSLPTKVGQTAARVSKWIQRSTMEPAVVYLDGGLRTAREAVKVWPLGSLAQLRDPQNPQYRSTRLRQSLVIIWRAYIIVAIVWKRKDSS